MNINNFLQPFGCCYLAFSKASTSNIRRAFYFMKFEQKESHMHKMAKQLLIERLKLEEKNNGFCSFKNISWRRNYGVFEELKFYSNSDKYYFECSDHLLPYTEDRKNDDPMSWIDYKKIGKILFVPDICIFNKGTPTIFIEVVHTNKVSQKKILEISNFFSSGCISIYEVKAQDIMNSITPDFEKMKFKLIYKN